jgi:hypothetical protein
MTDTPAGKLAWRPALFVTGSRPHVSWDYDGSRDQLQFLQSIDPDYFMYAAATHLPKLDTDQAIYASIAIRQIHAQAVETFFAVIGSVLQAPDCPAGWILNYQIGDLRELFNSINEYEPFHNRLGIRHSSWKAVVRAIFPFSDDDDQVTEYLDASEALWKGLAYHLIHERFLDEYNAIKHGLGFKAGEWQMQIRSKGAAAYLLQNQEFGTWCNRRERVEGKARQSYLRFQRVNWDPRALARRIPLLVASLWDVISLQVIRHGGGDLKDYRITLITRDMVRDALADPTGASATAWTQRNNFPYEAVPEFTRSEILESYEDIKDPQA